MKVRDCEIILEAFGAESGSPGRIRTADQRINSPFVMQAVSRETLHISSKAAAFLYQKNALI